MIEFQQWIGAKIPREDEEDQLNKIKNDTPNNKYMREYMRSYREKKQYLKDLRERYRKDNKSSSIPTT